MWVYSIGTHIKKLKKFAGSEWIDSQIKEGRKMTEDKKVIKDCDEDKKEGTDQQDISPSYANNPIANAHTLDIDTRVSIPSEDALVEVKEWGEENKQ